MVVMSIGITAIVAGYSSGILAVDRAKAGTTAGALADRQMETFRQGSFAAVPTSSGPSLRRPRTGTGCRSTGPGPARSAPSSRGPPPTCTSSPLSRPVKLVTITVRDGSAAGEAPLHRNLDLRLLDRLTNPLDPRNRHGCIRIRRNQRAGARDLRCRSTRPTGRGARAAAAARTPPAARWTSVPPPASAARRRVQEGQAEVAAGVRPPVRDDDRGRRQRRRGARRRSRSRRTTSTWPR